MAQVVYGQVIGSMMAHMPSSDYLEILFGYDRWATGEILKACEQLSDDQFHRRFEIGPGSLHDTTTHILGAMRLWTQVMGGVNPPQRLDQDGVKRKPAELVQLLDAITGDFAREAHRLAPSETVTRVRDGKSMQFTRGTVLMQVMTHGAHHRAQCLNMLRQTGLKPLPKSSVVEWTLFTQQQK
jgi:uncharacterized damage-inducible protein DinB